jgi:predicted RNA-binding Zn-ribbon protein involved in translation (DUF1610 family)
MKCARCDDEIPDGKQTVVWGPPTEPASVLFICPRCSEELERFGHLRPFNPLEVE